MARCLEIIPSMTLEGKQFFRSKKISINKYILLDVLVRTIAEYFYEFCRNLIRTTKYKQRVKILSDTTHQNV